MFKECTLDLMEKLTLEIGVSGDENNISKILKSKYEKVSDRIVYDNLGSIFAVKKSKKENPKKVMICAHMDEKGFIVEEILKGGTIKLLPLGDIDIKTNVRGILLNSKGEEIEGVISKGDSIELDIGASTREQVLDLNIEPLNQVVIKGEFKRLIDENRLLAKAWDNRFGCVLGIEVLESLKDVDLDFDLYVGATVQNHVGLRGSITSTNLIEPDLAIVTDCLEEKSDGGVLGEGLLVSFYDKSMMPNKMLLKYLINTCNREGIKYQNYYSLDDSDGGWIHKLLDGCPTLKLCIPGRNKATSNGIIDLRDYRGAKKGLISLLKSLKEENIELFKTENR